MGNHTPSQPADAWEFLPTDDAAEAAPGLPPEAQALHLERDKPKRRTSRDPGRSEVAFDTGPLEGIPVSYFDDEQPEHRSRWTIEDDYEPDLEQLLESQHYAFGPDPD